jgi:hypothetical protein
MSQNPQAFALAGGLDLVSPALAAPQGRIRAGLNHEPDVRGYRRIDGYERFDGQPKPSEAGYVVSAFSAGARAVVAGDEVIGSTSAAHGIVLVVTVDTGTWGAGTASGTFIIRPISGAFIDGEDIHIQSPTAFSSGFSTGFQ